MPSAARAVDTSAVRAWARKSGVKVADRGRLPAGLVEQFLTANPAAGGTGKPRATTKATKATKATGKPAASGSKATAAGSRETPPAPAGSRTAAAPTTTGPAGPAAEPDVSAATAQEAVDEVLLDDEQVELLKDLPAVLEELNAELDALQQALKDVQAENAQLKQRLDRLESKRGLFTRK